MNRNKRNDYLMSTLKLEESTSTLEIFPGKCDSEVHTNTRLRTLPAFPGPRTLKRFAEMPVKSSILYLNYFFQVVLIMTSSFCFSKEKNGEKNAKLFTTFIHLKRQCPLFYLRIQAM